VWSGNVNRDVVTGVAEVISPTLGLLQAYLLYIVAKASRMALLSAPTFTFIKRDWHDGLHVHARIKVPYPLKSPKHFLLRRIWGIYSETKLAQTVCGREA
jgi:hypothetical protein